jgi:hypothetical protein
MKLVSPDGKVTRALGFQHLIACGFSSDGARVYCIRQEKPSDPGVFFPVPVAGGPENVTGLVAPEDKRGGGRLAAIVPGAGREELRVRHQQDYEGQWMVSNKIRVASNQAFAARDSCWRCASGSTSKFHVYARI